MERRTGLGALALALASAAIVPAAAQDEAPSVTPAPAPASILPPVAEPPPSVVVVPAPTPTSIRSPAPPAIDRKWPSAPEPAAPRSIPLKGKERREYREAKQDHERRCFADAQLTPRLGERLVEACDWLLGEPTDPEAAWDYRARTLQFRALGLLNAGDYTMALEALDQSDAIGDAQADPLFDLGLGIGNDLLRAFILGQQDQTEAALAMLQEIRAKRPYARSIVRAADGIEVGIVGKLEAFAEKLAARQRTDPEVNRQLVGIYLILGQLEPADAFGDRISLVDPKMQGGWRLNGDEDPTDDLKDAIVVAGTRAYVAAALGEAAKAEALLAQVRQAVSDYVGPDPRTVTKRPNKGELTRYDLRKASAPRLLDQVASWEAIIALRRDLEAGTAENPVDRLSTMDKEGGLFPAMIELMGRYEAREAEAAGRSGPSVVAYLRNSLLTNEIAVPAGRLAKILPRSEYLAAIPKFKSNAGAWFWGGTMGYTQAKEGSGEIRTVRFESLSASPSVVEEMLLLAIANFARTEGKDGFVILTGRTISRQITTYGMWGGGSTSDAGYEAQARVRLVDTANLPPDLAGREARVITVAEIERDLLPRYDAYAARQAAAKAARKK